MQTWAGSDYWAMVVVPPSTVPVSVQSADYLRAAGTLERLDKHQAALDAYRAASRHWPDSFIARAGAGNAAFALSRLDEAETAYRQALRLNPGAASIMNNLALALAGRGCRQTALAAIECAIGRAPDNPVFAASRDEIRATTAGQADCVDFACAPAGR
jgi:tetratricopeptide (TPR) repeat protein